MNPKHKNPDSNKPERIAHAPYNFVPLPERAVPAEQNLPNMDRYYCEGDAEIGERYTGLIKCEIITESPVYVRGAIEPEAFKELKDKSLTEMNEMEKRQYARFFSPDNSGRPAIPGSSLRGMVRTLVEVAAYGKIPWVTNKPLVFRAVGDTSSLGTYYRKLLIHEDQSGRVLTPLMRAGYVVKEKDRWFIRPAQAIQGVTFARIHKNEIPSDLPKWHECKNAAKIWIRPGDYDYQKVRGFLRLKYTLVQEAKNSPTAGFMEAVLARSGDVSGKKKLEAVIYPPDESTDLIEINDELLQRYREQISPKQEELLGGKDGVLKHYQPVFYLLDHQEKLVFFGHTMMFRLPYEKSPYDFVPPGLRQDTSEVDIDLAEAIFGFTSHGEERRVSRAGRVFFSDAWLKPDQENIWFLDEGSEEPVIPKILSGPKPTAFQHYLTQQQPDKVETPRSKSGKPKMELRLDHYASPPPHDTVIRGHKYYWHKGKVGLSDIKDEKQNIAKIDKQHTLLFPVRPGVEFYSKIYFENLSAVELGAILWALVLPGDEGKEYRHKIGMGKPLGMGSIKIIPKLYLDDRKSRYKQLFNGNYWYQARNKKEAMNCFINAFEAYVLKELSPEDRQGAEKLAKIERVQMLLKLLEWPGLKDRKLTDYMNIKPTNEFKDRPVLPDPLHVET